MPTQIKVQIPPRLREAAVILDEQVNLGLRQSGLIIEAEAKKKVRVATGNLRRSIASTVAPLSGSPTAIIFAAAKYAASVEHGSKPHTAPLGPIQRWANRKGMSGGAVWMQIRRQGTKKHPFMHPAYEAKLPSVIKRMQGAIADAVARMGGE